MKCVLKVILLAEALDIFDEPSYTVIRAQKSRLQYERMHIKHGRRPSQGWRAKYAGFFLRPAAHQRSIMSEASVSSQNFLHEISPSYIQTGARILREQTFCGALKYVETIKQVSDA